MFNFFPRGTCGRSRTRAVHVAVYLRFPAVLCGCRTAENRGLNRISVKGVSKIAWRESRDVVVRSYSDVTRSLQNSNLNVHVLASSKYAKLPSKNDVSIYISLPLISDQNALGLVWQAHLQPSGATVFGYHTVCPSIMLSVYSCLSVRLTACMYMMRNTISSFLVANRSICNGIFLAFLCDRDV